MYLVNTCNLYDFSAYSRVSHNSENGVESDDLLFPIEEVVDNTSVENINSESGNMTSHAIYEHLCTHLKYILETWFNCIWKKKIDGEKMESKLTFSLKKGMLISYSVQHPHPR